MRSRRNTELLLLLAATPPVLLVFALLDTRQAGTFTYSSLFVPGALLVAFLIAHVAVRRFAPSADPGLLPVTFVLAASGHIAGVISPPGSKYEHWTGDKLPASPEEWFAGAEAHRGSWWPCWDTWVTQFDNGRVKARTPGDHKLKVIEDAPGSYVRVRAM